MKEVAEKPRQVDQLRDSTPGPQPHSKPGQQAPGYDTGTSATFKAWITSPEIRYRDLSYIQGLDDWPRDSIPGPQPHSTPG
jgi:hypothetical protein